MLIINVKMFTCKIKYYLKSFSVFYLIYQISVITSSLLNILWIFILLSDYLRNLSRDQEQNKDILFIGSGL